jgi:hypothetical protein
MNYSINFKSIMNLLNFFVVNQFIIFFKSNQNLIDHFSKFFIINYPLIDLYLPMSCLTSFDLYSIIV